MLNSNTTCTRYLLIIVYTGKIKCHGYMSAYSKCTFETDNPSEIQRFAIFFSVLLSPAYSFCSYRRIKFKYPSQDEIEEIIAEMKEEKIKQKEAAFEAIAGPIVSLPSTHLHH